MIKKEDIQKFLGRDPESQARKARLSASRVELFHRGIPSVAKGIIAGGAVLAMGDLGRAQAAKDQQDASLLRKLEQALVVDGIKLVGVPQSVDINTVDIAKGLFKNDPDLIPHIFATPGGLLVGPDFGNPDGSPWGGNPDGWKTMYESGGSIQPFSSVTQEIVRWSGEAFQDCPEGGFAMFSGAQMTLEFGDMVVSLPNRGPGHKYIAAVRGHYPDGKKDSDLNSTIRATDYIPGHFETLMYQSRAKTNLGFIDLEQVLQMVGTSHTGATNCGAEGCSNVTLLGFDAGNSKAIEWSRHATTEQDAVKAYVGAHMGWVRMYSNFR